MGILGTAKPLASLSSGLLARKGQARPAMRPQGFASLAPSAAALDDLGWNDMGAETPAMIVPMAAEIEQPAAPVATPPVLVERAALAREIGAPDDAPVEVAPAASIIPEVAERTRKAAFTLRLDPARHLRLRLASAMANRSAQALVAEALDRFLDANPSVGALAAQLPQPEASR